MNGFLDRTLWILSKPSISTKINSDRSRGAFGTLYQLHMTLKPMNGQYTDKLKVCMYKVLVFQLLIANYFEITFKVTWTLAMWAVAITLHLFGTTECHVAADWAHFDL
jgi:hypothetical protein